MAQSTNLSALKTKHAELDTLIEQEVNRPLPDETFLSQLKRRKLRIKDELAQLGE